MDDQHLNLTPEIRDHWEDVIRFIENERPQVEYTVQRPFQFNMDYWIESGDKKTKGCGTFFCIAGAENLVHYANTARTGIVDFGDCRDASEKLEKSAERLGLSEEAADALFYPLAVRSGVHGALCFESTKEQVVRVLRAILSGDVVYNATVKLWVWKYALEGDDT